MDLQSMFSDNQLAVMGCFAALSVCAGIAGLSYRFGPAGQKSMGHSAMKQSIHPIRPQSSGQVESDTAQEPRRAA